MISKKPKSGKNRCSHFNAHKLNNTPNEWEYIIISESKFCKAKYWEYQQKRKTTSRIKVILNNALSKTIQKKALTHG